MTRNKNKLELTWIGKENRPRLEPRILLEDPEKSYHAPHRVSDDDIFDNRLIFGDNLLALKALEQDFSGKIKCIYIDPPFNTQQDMEHYPDGLEHSAWLGMMRDRIDAFHRLLSDDGSLFIHIDDNEMGYLIAVVDEIFGRKNRISIITFKQSSVSGPKSINPGIVTTSNFLLYYVKDKTKWSPKRVLSRIPRDTRYNTFIENFEAGYKHWTFRPLKTAFAQRVGIDPKHLKRHYGDDLESEIDTFVLANAERVTQPGRVKAKDVSEEARKMLQNSIDTKDVVFKEERADKEDRYFLNGKQILFYSSKVSEIDGERVTGQAISSIWDDLLSNNIHKEGGVSFPGGKKPELLLKRVLELSTSANDWVLDSFAGSGTTGAVAHKMGRRWIMVELGEHCHTHIMPRLNRLIDGHDTDGVTKATKWKGGGGYRFYALASSLLEQDEFGNWIISRKYNPAMLAEAMCKLEGFTYAPSDEVYWQQGHSTETDFIYVTTQTVSREQLHKLNDEVGPNRSLLICCGAYRTKRLEDFPYLTVKKIPKAVMQKCEWGKDDYSLEIKALPDARPTEAEPVDEVLADLPKNKRKARKMLENSPTLFPMEDAQ